MSTLEMVAGPRRRQDCGCGCGGCGGSGGSSGSGKRELAGGRWVRRGDRVVVLLGGGGAGGAPPWRELEMELESEVGSQRTTPAYIRWVQQSLNRVLGLRLPPSGVADVQTRSAIRSFQQQRRLTVDGIVGPITERALLAAGASPPPSAAGAGRSLGGSPGPLSADAVRWVQHALNQILSLRLVVDGVMGPQTRSAVRSFQQKQGLPATGNVDAQTSQRLVLALGGPATSDPCIGLNSREVLDRFEFNKDRVLPQHQQKIIAIARCVIASQKTASPIRALRVVGHTDVEGTDAYNDKLGERRAREVSRHLKETLDRILPGSSARVTITPESRGEREAFSPDAARNRRAEIYLPIKRPPPPPPPPHTPPRTIELCERQTLKIWLNAFIPRHVAGLTRTVPGTGVHAGGTMIPSLPGIGECFLTDQRSFSDSLAGITSRMHSEADISLLPPRLLQQRHFCDETVEVDCRTGKEVCRRRGNSGRMRFTNFRASVPSHSFVIEVDLEGAANNPCFRGSPDIDYRGTVRVVVAPRTGAVEVQFSGVVDAFPAFEMYAKLGSVVIPLFRQSPRPGASPFNLAGPATVSATGRARFTCSPIPVARLHSVSPSAASAV